MTIGTVVVGLALGWATQSRGAEGDAQGAVALGSAQSAHALFAVDRNRSAIVEGIVSQWRGSLEQSYGAQAPARIDELRAALAQLRADRLFAASLAGTVDGLAQILSERDPVPTPHTDLKLLGDAGQDLTYTPVTPCRIADTRSGSSPFNSPVLGGSAFAVSANLSSYTSQGGANNNCGLPATYRALVAVVTVLSPNYDAFLAASDTSVFGTLSQAVVMNFSANKGLSNTAVIPVDGTTKFYLGLPSLVTTHVLIDVVGFFRAPANILGDITGVTAGTGITGGGTTGTVSVALSAGYQLPQACANLQVPKWSVASSLWTCANDDTAAGGGGGSVTQVNTGSGLIGGPITTTGTLSLSPSYSLPQSCTNGQVAKANGAGGWTCGTDNNSAGTVTSVATGAGLAGGPVTTTGTLSIATGYQLPQSCTNGQVPKSNGTGGWTCGTDNGSGSVTSVASGTGLTGGPVTTTGTLSLATGYQLPQSCTNGQLAKSNGAGAWNCATESGGTVTSVASGTGLTGGPVTTTGTLSLATGYQLPQSCTNGQVPKSNGAGSWACAADAGGVGTVTSVTAGVGLNGGTITGSGTIAISTSYLDGFYLRQGGNAFGSDLIVGSTDNTAVELRANSARYLRIEPSTVSPNVLIGHPTNSGTAGVRGATIAGGGAATGDTDPSFTGEGPNRVTDHYGFVGGGYANTAGNNDATLTNSPFAAVVGGQSNTASGTNSFVGGGYGNTASGAHAVASGGSSNVVSGQLSVVAGGGSNQAQGLYASVPGGNQNTATGDYSFAAGLKAGAAHAGAFVWADSTNVPFDSTAANQFLVRAANGVGINTTFPTATIDVNGQASQTVANVTSSNTVGTWVNLKNTSTGGTNFNLISTGQTSPQGAGNFLLRSNAGAGIIPLTVLGGSGRVGLMQTNPAHPLQVGTDTTNGNGAHVTIGGVWTNGSSRTFKEAFAAVDGRSVLARLVALPILTWSYRNDPSVRHIGPIAEEFRAAFGFGSDERYIGTVDADGVALAAIKGLHSLLEDRDQTIASQGKRIADLESRLERLLREVKALVRTR